MKNSGIPWIGEIPEKWKVELIGNNAKEVDNPNIDNAEDNALQFKMGSIISKKNGDSKYNPATLEAYNKVKKGDIVINGLNLSFDYISQRIGLVKEDGVITSAYLAIRPTSAIKSEYLNYLFKAYDNCKAFHGMGKGLRQTLAYKELRNYLLCFPPLADQQAIADFLDKKCAEIDQMVALQEKFIEELKAYKQSLITETVTKGLNPNAPMKDSGVEWIGEVPVNWDVCKLKHIYTLVNGRAYSDPELLSEGKYKVLRVGNLFTSDKWYYSDMELEPDKYCQEGDLLYGWSASIGPYLWNHEKVIYHYHIWKVLFKNIRQFAFYQLHALTEAKRRDMHGSAMQHLTMDGMNNSYLTMPPKREQQAIADYLDKKCAEIDQLITIKQKKADELKEYKKSIIYEYVTGKRSVCE